MWLLHSLYIYRLPTSTRPEELRAISLHCKNINQVSFVQYRRFIISILSQVSSQKCRLSDDTNFHISKQKCSILIRDHSWKDRRLSWRQVHWEISSLRAEITFSRLCICQWPAIISDFWKNRWGRFFVNGRWLYGWDGGEREDMTHFMRHETDESRFYQDRKCDVNVRECRQFLWRCHYSSRCLLMMKEQSASSFLTEFFQMICLVLFINEMIPNGYRKCGCCCYFWNFPFVIVVVVSVNVK